MLIKKASLLLNFEFNDKLVFLRYDISRETIVGHNETSGVLFSRGFILRFASNKNVIWCLIL